MDLPFRTIREGIVMCTTEDCPHSATFMLVGIMRHTSTGSPLVAAYCDQHALETASRLGYSWPHGVRRPRKAEERADTTRIG